MKTTTHSLAFLTMLMVGAAAFLGGCATSTTGMDRSGKTSTSIEEVENEIVKMDAQLDKLSLIHI